MEVEFTRHHIPYSGVKLMTCQLTWGGNFPSNPQEEKLYFQGKDLLGDLWELRSVPISSSGAVGKIITSILVSHTLWQMGMRDEIKKL